MQEPSGPEHPYQNTWDARYIPPQNCISGAPSKQADPAYDPITMMQHELLSLSPEVWSQFWDATMCQAKTVPNRMYCKVFSQTLKKTSKKINPSLSPPILLLSSCLKSWPLFWNLIQSLHPGKAPDPDYLIVAKESSALCSIMPLFNNAKMELGWCWVLKLWWLVESWSVRFEGSIGIRFSLFITDGAYK